MTFIAALRCDRIDAPIVFYQPINGATFTQWLDEQLCPTLDAADIVISTTSPAIRSRPSAPRSEPEARASCSCRPAPTLIRSSRSSLSLSISCARPPNEHRKQHGSAPARCSTPSRQMNAPITSTTQATVQPNVIRLYSPVNNTILSVRLGRDNRRRHFGRPLPLLARP